MIVKRGFSLIEVLIFITVLSLFFVFALTVTTSSLRNMKIQEHKIIATRYAQAGIEWVKQEKEDEWSVFTAHDTSAGAGTNYCLNSHSLNWSTKTDCGVDYALGPPYIFKRVLTITNSGNPVDKITAKLVVSWLENNVEQKITIKSVLNLWE